MCNPSILRAVMPALLLLCALAAPAAGQATPSAEVLMPYFALDLANPDNSDVTLFAVCNHGEEPAAVTLTVYSNWGVSVLSTKKTLAADEAMTVNLRDWLITGTLPDRQLSPAEIAHVQAALSGKPSAQDHLYYGTEVRPDLAVGYVVAHNGDARDSLWGDFFTLVPGQRVFQSDHLVNVDRSTPVDLPCKVHAVRFLEAGPYEEVGTHLVIWSGKHGLPSAQPTPPEWVRLHLTLEVYDEAGDLLEERPLSLLPVQVLELKKLDPPLPPPFGWLQVDLETEGFVGVDFNAVDQLTGGLHSYCVPPEQQAAGPELYLEKRVNGQDADVAPGPIVEVGSPLVWTFEVTNTGSERLYGLQVSDNSGLAITCPVDELGIGESVVCTASSAAAGCQQSNEGRATAVDIDNNPVAYTDLAFYYGQYLASLGFLAVTANGLDARTPPGPGFTEGDPIAWAFQVKNTGNGPLTQVALTAAIPVSCPKTTLEPDEAMTCTASSTAAAGNQTMNLQAHGTSPCGNAVDALTTAYYFGIAHVPRIDVQKLTNGEPGDEGTGPTVLVGSTVLWTYVVTNTGDVPLAAVAVSDNKLPAVSCPGTVLQPGASMTCNASGTAIAGQYRNTATAIGTPPSGPPVTDTDTSQYYGVSPAIALEKLVNGNEADTPPGPIVLTGSTLLWTYVVTNVGDYRLNTIVVTDSQPLVVSCPGTTLEPSASMTCTATSTAISGLHTNLGTVTASWDGPGRTVTASDPANYTGQSPSIAIEKRTNGDDADVPPGPTLQVGAAVAWAYLVTNTGDVTLSNVIVSDDHPLVVSCPKNVLAPGEAMTCTASGTALAGQYMNVGTAVGTPPAGPAVSAQDMSHYFGAEPRIAIEKLVNGFEADTEPAAITVLKGSNLQFTYFVTNSGNLALSAVNVTDNQGLAVSCPKTALQPGESMTCTASAAAAVGLHGNIGTAVGTPSGGGSNVTASDPAWYFGADPKIRLTKKVNGHDANDQDHAVHVQKGAKLTFTFEVTNTGNVTLTSVTVTDVPASLTPTCPKTTLVPGESMTCTKITWASTKCLYYMDTGTATGTPSVGGLVSDSDVAWYAVD